MKNDSIVNQVFYPGSIVPLTPAQLANEAGPGMTAADYPGRILGRHCSCSNGGKFTLLAKTHPLVKSGEKRYIICRICNECSHL